MIPLQSISFTNFLVSVVPFLPPLPFCKITMRQLSPLFRIAKLVLLVITVADPHNKLLYCGNALTSVSKMLYMLLEPRL